MPTSSFFKEFVVSGKDAERFLKYINDPDTGVKLDRNFKSRLMTKEELEMFRAQFKAAHECKQD